MALSKTISADTSRHLVWVNLTVTETNINENNNNKSTLNYEVTLTKGSAGWNTAWSSWGTLIYFTFQIAGKSFGPVYVPVYNYGGQYPPGSVFASGSFEVEHENDGSKLIDMSISFVDNANGYNNGRYYTPGNGSASATNLELETIPRASIITCSSGNIGETVTMVVDTKSSNFTNNITYEIGSLTGTIKENATIDDKVLQLPTNTLIDAIYAEIPDDKEIDCNIYCTTYNGETQIGDVQVAPFKLYAVESECSPIIASFTVDKNEATKALTGDPSFLVRYMSKPQVVQGVQARKSATITSFFTNMNDGQTSTQQTPSFDTINSTLITSTVTDSRGYIGTTEEDLTNRMINYVKLHINTFSVTRPEGTSNEAILNANGAYFNGNFSENTPNVLNASFQYKKEGESEWIEGGSITPTIENNSFSFNNYSLGNLFDYNYEYQIKLILSDLLMTVGSSDKDAQTLENGQEVVAIGEDGVDVYGNLRLNDGTVPFFAIEETWEES